MVKRKSDEPDDKALQRLRQFEAQRESVPEEEKDKDKKKKDKHTGADEGKKAIKPDKATDLLNQEKTKLK